jgi:hypothetical protein
MKDTRNQLEKLILVLEKEAVRRKERETIREED